MPQNEGEKSFKCFLYHAHRNKICTEYLGFERMRYLFASNRSFVISQSDDQNASKYNLHGTLAPIHLKFLPLFLLFGNLFLGWLSFLWDFSESLFLLNQNNFDVTRGGHVRIDTTVSPVGPTSHFWGPVDLNVVNDQMISIQTWK